jgi:hypothetical protein
MRYFAAISATSVLASSVPPSPWKISQPMCSYSLIPDDGGGGAFAPDVDADEDRLPVCELADAALPGARGKPCTLSFSTDRDGMCGRRASEPPRENPAAPYSGVVRLLMASATVDRPEATARHGNDLRPRAEEAARYERRERLIKSERQTTPAKLERERLVQERRTLKRERQQAAAARDETAAKAADGTTAVVPGG